MQLIVGEAFPLPIVDGGIWWDTTNNLLVVSGSGLADDSDEDLTVERVWVTTHGPVITLTLSTSVMSVDVPGVWRDAQPQRPQWITECLARPDSHLAITAVWVDDSDKVIRKLQMLTLSPHVTQYIAKAADRLWGAPLTSTEVVRAAQAWALTYPTPQAVKKGARVTSRAGA